MYHNSIQELKRFHGNLFKKEGVTVVSKRNLGFANSTLIIVEGCLRVLATEKHLKSKAEAFFLQLQDQYDNENSSPFQVKNIFVISFIYTVQTRSLFLGAVDD